MTFATNAALGDLPTTGGMRPGPIGFVPATPRPVFHGSRPVVPSSNEKAASLWPSAPIPEGEPLPTLVLNLVRLSRGKMLGVDQNRDLTWVGGTVGIWPAD